MGGRVNDTRIERVALLVDEVQGCGDSRSAALMLRDATDEWFGFAQEFPLGDLDVARVGILLRKSRSRFDADDTAAAYPALSAAQDAIRRVAAR